MATQQTTTEPTMFVRDSGEYRHHITTGWQAAALCGARPYMRAIGWTLGTTSSVFGGVAEVCTDCQDANRARLMAA